LLSADCDFARGKHHGRVTCVPLLTAEEYLVEMWIPKIREQVVEKRMYELRELLARAEAPPISDNRLREWASEVLPAEIAEQLELQVSATGEN
jgi:hypothetical protein